MALFLILRGQYIFVKVRKIDGEHPPIIALCDFAKQILIAWIGYLYIFASLLSWSVAGAVGRA